MWWEVKSLPQKIMALFNDIEPPSSGDKKDDRGFHNFIQTLKTKAVFKRLPKVIEKNMQRLSFCIDKVKNRWQKIKNFADLMITNKYLPHIAISVLAILVAFSNIHDRVQAYNLQHEVNNIDPNIELSISDNIDPYTELIADDSKNVEISFEAAEYATGFVANAAPTSTQITAREEPLPDNSTQSVYYIVRNSDTLSGLGWKFGVKVATLAYVNDLSNNDLIKPGTRLKIPVRGYEVSATLIAQKQAAKTAAASSSSSTKTTTKTLTHAAGSTKNGYPYGYCTYYVATRRAVPSQWGNAGQWLNSAKNAGYSTGSTPVAGAIMVSRESIWGHVAYVESVNGNEFTVSEMNAPIWGVVTRRTISSSDSKIKGFIY